MIRQRRQVELALKNLPPGSGGVYKIRGDKSTGFHSLPALHFEPMK
jgi:hypothetical protein